MTSSFQIRILGALAFFAGAAMACAAAAKSPLPDGSTMPAPVKRTVQYFGDIHPILSQYCISCHGPEKQKGGLRLDSREAALEGGESYGPAIVPGKSIDSPLVLFISHLEPDMEMPPKKDQLPEQTVAVLRAWIDQGAKWPAQAALAKTSDRPALGNQEQIFKKAATHWAFQPVVKADAASLTHGPAAIDALVAAKLQEKGLARSPRADAKTLLRRLHFDLAGLPPTPEELDQFAAAFAKDADAALAAKADELLASPHFGERWGRYWLDLARYADTQDFFPQPDLRYPFAWTYRDYVVNAFNEDKPYDRFVQEQIAADQLGLSPNDPTLAALGYLTVGPRFLRRNDEVINDRIDVIGRGLMGLTVACARCHDHKFDPIPTADFYALYGVFASTEDLTELPEITLAGARVDLKARADYEAAKAGAQKALANFTHDLKEKAVADVLAMPEIYFDAISQIEVKKTATVTKMLSGRKMMETALMPLDHQWTALKSNGPWREDPVLSPLACVMAAPPKEKAALIEGVIQSGSVPAGKTAVHPLVLAAMRDAKPADEEALVRLYGKMLAQAKTEPSNGLKEVVKAFTGDGSLLDFSAKDLTEAVRASGKGRKELDKLETAVTGLESTHPGAPSRAMTVKDKAKMITPAIFIRGDSARRGENVDRRFLQLFDPKKTPFAADKSGRLELAEKIASEQNPLTPRVWANHVWRHLLGRPLVRTPGDFGLQAEPPSHPKLLDWLASALMQRGWSTKKLVRDIVLSQTYQQSSGDRPGASAVDADNSLLWRANCRRLDFESMRDAMLATSGQLDPAVGGRPVNLSAEPFSCRRTIYGLVDRVNPDPLFTTFDFPSADIANTERSQTLVPQQALFALNDGFIVDQARRLADKAQAAVGHSDDPDAVIAWLYRRVFLRAPSAEEAMMSRAFMKETADLDPSSEGAPGHWQYGVGSADPATPRAEAFQPLSYFDPQARRYQGGRVFPDARFGFASLIASGGHPDLGLGKAAIRRWIVPSTGEFSMAGEISVMRQGTGDGVRARVISSKSGLLGEWVADGAAAKTELPSVKLVAGEILDFAVDCRETTTSDSFLWPLSIKLLNRAEKLPAQAQTVWNAQTDFKGPPPPKLQPLEQIAQALLMTNEFFFVD
jgi:mono/diheme cytochrome c family protein